MRRREFLVGTSITVTSFAGCSGLGNNSSTPSPSTVTDKPEPTPPPEEVAEPSTPTEAEPPKAPSAAVTQQRFVSEELPSGDTAYFMTGHVENTGDFVLASPEVLVEFYDEASSVIGVTSAAITRLGIGQVWDVQVEYLGGDADPEPTKGVISLATLEPASAYELPVELTIEEATLETTTPPKVTGTVTNMSDATLHSVFGYTDFLTDNDHVLGMGEDSIADLKPDETWEFTVDYITFDEARIDRITDYELYFII
jgi:hypothetical protein